MKNLICIIMILTLLLAAAACASLSAEKPSESALAPSDSVEPSVSESQEILVFSDKALETKVREIMNKPEGGISAAEAKTVIKLDLANESFDDMNSKNGGIRDISSLKYFTCLEELNLSFNDISDFSPLAELKSLKSLGFTGVRPKDLSLLKGLTNMVCLVFDWCYSPDQGYTECSNLDFMADMKDLEIFEAKGAGITDITVLGTLPKLWSVFLDANQITDITPLANLKNLKELLLSQNPITDYSPVKDVYPNLIGKDFEIK